MILQPGLLTAANVHSPLEGLGTAVNNNKNLYRFTYDFSVLGGAVGTVQLKDDQGNAAVLPAGAIIERAYIDVVTSLTSGGAATVALRSVNAADILAATAIAGLAAGLVEAKQLGTMATAIKMPSTVPQTGQPVSAVIAVAALTAGKFYLVVEVAQSGF